MECAHWLRLPKRLLDATGGVAIDNEIIVCGGEEDSRIANRLCYRLMDHFSNIPTVVSNLLATRVGADSLVTDNGTTLWITGGLDNETDSQSTELINVNDEDGVPILGPQLPFSLKHHCLEKIASNIVILVGGLDKKGILSMNSFSIRLDTKIRWQSQPHLLEARFKHACGVVKDESIPGEMIVIVAGGLVLKNGLLTATDTVELLHVKVMESDLDGNHFSLKKDDWEMGERLPKALSGAASASTADQTRLLMVGSNAIYVLQCQDLDCTWITLEQSFSGSQPIIALILPASPMGPLLGLLEGTNATWVKSDDKAEHPMLDVFS